VKTAFRFGHHREHKVQDDGVERLRVERELACVHKAFVDGSMIVTGTIATRFAHTYSRLRGIKAHAVAFFMKNVMPPGGLSGETTLRPQQIVRGCVPAGSNPDIWTAAGVSAGIKDAATGRSAGPLALHFHGAPPRCPMSLRISPHGIQLLVRRMSEVEPTRRLRAENAGHPLTRSVHTLVRAHRSPSTQHSDAAS
jgi:hypothetical protein